MSNHALWQLRPRDWNERILKGIGLKQHHVESFPRQMAHKGGVYIQWHIRAVPIPVSLTLSHTDANCSESYSGRGGGGGGGVSLLVAPLVNFPIPFLDAERLVRRQ